MSKKSKAAIQKLENLGYVFEANEYTNSPHWKQSAETREEEIRETENARRGSEIRGKHDFAAQALEVLGLSKHYIKAAKKARKVGRELRNADEYATPVSLFVADIEKGRVSAETLKAERRINDALDSL